MIIKHAFTIVEQYSQCTCTYNKDTEHTYNKDYVIETSASEDTCMTISSLADIHHCHHHGLLTGMCTCTVANVRKQASSERACTPHNKLGTFYVEEEARHETAILDGNAHFFTDSTGRLKWCNAEE